MAQFCFLILQNVIQCFFFPQSVTYHLIVYVEFWIWLNWLECIWHELLRLWVYSCTKLFCVGFLKLPPRELFHMQHTWGIWMCEFFIVYFVRKSVKLLLLVCCTESWHITYKIIKIANNTGLPYACVVSPFALYHLAHCL